MINVAASSFLIVSNTHNDDNSKNYFMKFRRLIMGLLSFLKLKHQAGERRNENEATE